MTRHDSDPSPKVDIQIKKRYFDVLTKVNDEMKSIALHRSTELQLFSRLTSQTLNFKSELQYFKVPGKVRGYEPADRQSNN